MTLEEAKKLNHGFGYITKPSPVATMPTFVPPTDEVLGLEKTPESSPSYNGLSINDCKLLNKFKYSDDLHRPDLINSSYERAKGLSDFGKEVGAKEFINSYIHK